MNNNFDPITLEIIKHELISIPNQIDKNITRTAFSPLINEYKDYAVGIVDIEGKLISQSRGSLAIFVANALGTAVKDGVQIYGLDAIKHGDVIISNHAGTLGQHLNNVVMYTPITDQSNQKTIGFFCVLMHWIDIGGIMVGSCTSTSTTEIYQEGIQFRSVKLFSQGIRCDDMFRMIEYNTRFPDALLGDVESQIAGCFMGRDIVEEIIHKFSYDEFDAAIQMMWDHSDKKTRAAIKTAKNGVYSAYSFLDNDGIYLDKIVPIGIKVIVDNDNITIDFSEVSDQLPGPLNAGRNGGAVAAARIAMKYLFSPNDPVNEGDFRALNVVIPEGKFLSAKPNAAIGGSGNMIPTVVDTILKALGQAYPDRVAAAHHGTYGVHAFHGVSPLTKAPFFHLDTCVGGWGATQQMDGYGPSRSNVHGDTSDVPIEMQEAFHPYRIENYGIRQDSAGAGQFRGGVGAIKNYVITGPCQLNLKIDRTKCPPWGLNGGLDGVTSDVEILRTDGSTQRVFKGNHHLNTGDRVTIKSGGGGGFGEPLNRKPEEVRKDVQNGYISLEHAMEKYQFVQIEK
ncbi:MAG: hydantoinase B/oxoprolinase family protein [Betaproteobacteria bacterium]